MLQANDEQTQSGCPEPLADMYGASWGIDRLTYDVRILGFLH